MRRIKGLLRKLPGAPAARDTIRNVTKVMNHYTLSFTRGKRKSPADKYASNGASSCGAAFLAKQPARRSTHFHISEFACHAGWHISPADFDSRCEPFALIPPLTPIRLAEKTQVFPIRKNTHGDPQTLQNKHWHPSAIRPTLTVQARSQVCSSLAKPLATVCGAFLWRQRRCAILHRALRL